MKRLTVRTALCALLVVFVAGCQETPGVFNRDAVLARAGEHELRMREAVANLPQGVSGDDSVAFMKLFIDRWVKQQLKLDEAEVLFSDSVGGIEKQVEAYRQALLIRKLEQHYVDRNLDTAFTPEEIAAYYNAHKGDFRLDRTLVRGRIVRFPTGYRQAQKLRSLMSSSGPAQQQDFRDICAKNEFEVTDFKGDWVDYQEFLSHLPTLRTQNYDALLSSNGVQEMRDNRSRYYFQLEGVRRAGETSPLERVRATIRRILFTQRQGEIIRRHEEELYKRASEEGELHLPEAAADE